MARSPVRRDDRRGPRDRYDDRDHGRDVRRRSRSPRDRDRDLTRTQRYYDDRDRDRGYSRRDRSRDRYDRYGSRRDRDRSRDRDSGRKRSRGASPVRSRHERGGYRDDYGNSDRKRPRHDDSPRHSHRGDSRERRSTKSSSVRDNESPRPSTADDSERKTKEARLAKLAAFKRKVEEKRQQELKGSASPAVDAPIAADSSSKPASPLEVAKPFAGKFDPKAVAKRAAAAMERSKATLDGGVPAEAPKQAGSMSNGGLSAASVTPKVAGISNAVVPKPAFGLSKAAPSGSAQPSKPKATSGLDDDAEEERKLERLPDLPTADNAGSPAVAAEDAGSIRSDEEEAEATREAAQKRAEEVPVANGDENTATPVPADVVMEDEEEIDPLDAFMSDLTVPQGTSKFSNLAVGKDKKKQPQVFNSDDEGDLDAVGDNADDILAITKKRKKDIPTVDHAKIQYDPFRKSFYSESVELAEMSQDDLDVLRAELDNITITGKDAPKPILKWSQGGFGAQLLDVIREMKFEKPTPIQSQTLPAVMSGRDTIGIAKTGSGKTIAYLLPMFRHIKDQRSLDNLEGPIGLVLAPTRELATQIHRDCKPFLKALNLRAVCAYGGAPIKDQIAELKRGAEIVVCTPGRMIDLLAANSGRVTNLKRVTYVVLDEADRMFDMGFEPQITKILNNIRPDRQTVLFSATFPKNMETIARKTLSKPVTILVGGKSVVAEEITQVIEVRAENSRFRRLLELLGELHDVDEDARSLIFVERQETADNMLKELAKKGYPAVSIHGGRDQIDRDQAISDFKAGHIPVMVATSVAARGLDVKQLKLVVNYDPPNHHEDYVHRVGRTGRAGNKGTAVTFVSPDQDRFASFLIKALKDSKQEIPEALQQLEISHKEKVKSGEAKKAGSGFGGKGIEKLDAARDAQKAIERKQHKLGDEPEEDDEKDEKKTDKKQSEVDKLVAKAAGQIKDRDALAADASSPAPTGNALPTALADHLNRAMKVSKVEKPDPSSRPGKHDPLAAVTAAAAAINGRLGGRNNARPGVPVDNHGPDAGAFHATLEINDFPQKARWAVTNRTNVAKILEATGTSITTKGNYYAPGKEPQQNEQPKLYILVEGDTDVAVETAMGELTRLLREGTVAALESESARPAGRYSVV